MPPPSTCSCEGSARPAYVSSNAFTRMLFPRSEFDPVKSQWKNPNDILSILTIIGGDIVQRAVAQLVGHPSNFAPVAFSFGWVGYSLNAVLSAIGEGRLMPPSDCDCILMNAKSGYVKENRSWILGRLVRDYQAPTPDTGLTISLYNADTSRPAGVPSFDWIYFSGIVTIFIQLGVAVIPGVVNQDWNALIITIAGTLLSLAGGALPQWRREKWACRRLRAGERKVVCLTKGNGFKDVLVIISEGEGQLRLEDLATPRHSRDRVTIVATCVLFVLQIALLLTVAGLDDHAWYLLAIGALGMLQNGLAAGTRRSPATLGIHLTKGKIIYDSKVFDALVKAEEVESHVGVSLLPIFFPGGLRKQEEEWRQQKLAGYVKLDDGKAQTKKTVPSQQKKVPSVNSAPSSTTEPKETLRS